MAPVADLISVVTLSPFENAIFACGLSGPRRPYAGSARDFVLGVRLLKLPAENTSYYRVYAWLSIAAGACFVTFFLSPLGALIDAAATIVLAMLFFKPDPEDPKPEFV